MYNGNITWKKISSPNLDTIDFTKIVNIPDLSIFPHEHVLQDITSRDTGVVVSTDTGLQCANNIDSLLGP